MMRFALAWNASYVEHCAPTTSPRRRGRLGVAAAPLGAGPPLRRQSVVAFVGQDEVIQEGDAE